MKVLITLDSLNRGGGEILQLDVCRNAKKNGLDLIFCSTGKGELENDFRDSGVKYFQILRRWALDPFLLLKLRKLIIEQKINIVHFHQAVDGIHLYFATLGLNVKKVQTYHGFIKSAKKDNYVARFLANKVDAQVFVSHGFSERFRMQSKIPIKNNCSVIYNGIDTSKIVLKNRKLREELKIKENELLLGMIGNFVSWKDQKTICKALKLVINKVPKFKFVFVGNKNEESYTEFADCLKICRENNLLDHVIFLGIRKDVLEILASLDIFIFATLEDTFGNAVIEAMLAEVPVIASDIKPILEISDNGKYVKLFKTSDENDLAEKIIGLVQNAEEISFLKKEAKRWALENFSIEKHINSLLKLYRSL